MRSSTFSIAAIFALVASVAAAPVASTEELVSVATVEEIATAAIVVVEADSEEVEGVDVSGVYHLLEKRTQKCTNGKSSSCSQTIPSNANRVCSNKVCTWACNSGYTKSGTKCNKKASSSVSLAATSSYSGTGTYFYQNGQPGACGTYSSDSTYLVALQTSMYAGGSKCGKNVKITGNGKTITAKVMDECPSCVSTGSLDLSVAAFKALASLDAGVVNIKWTWA